MRSCRTPGKDSAPYRAEKRREREREEQVARDILAAPESTDADREWARSVIITAFGNQRPAGEAVERRLNMEKQRRDRQKAAESFWYQLRHLEILKPVEPEDFEFALRLGSAAATGQMPMKSPARRDVTFEMEPGGSRTIR